MEPDPKLHLAVMDLLAGTRKAFLSVNEFAHEVSSDFGEKADDIWERLREMEAEIADLDGMTRGEYGRFIEHVQGINQEVTHLFGEAQAYLSSKIHKTPEIDA